MILDYISDTHQDVIQNTEVSRLDQYVRSLDIRRGARARWRRQTFSSMQAAGLVQTITGVQLVWLRHDSMNTRCGPACRVHHAAAAATSMAWTRGRVLDVIQINCTIGEGKTIKK